jgi:hypothetical protein
MTPIDDIARLETELAAADEHRAALKAKLRKTKASERQRQQRAAALEKAIAKRREYAEARKNAPPEAPPQTDWVWGMQAIANELGCDVARAGYLFRAGKLGDAVEKLGARTIRGSRTKLAGVIGGGS